MTERDTFTEVHAILKRFTGGDGVIQRESKLIQDLDLDSVKVMELLMLMEDHFDISIPLNVLPDVSTVGDLARQIDKLL